MKHKTTFDAEGVNEGDYIAAPLVARVAGQLGDRIDAHTDAPDTELLLVTATSWHDNVQRALLFHPESGLFLRATNTEHRKSWKVHEFGENIVVEDAEVEEWPEDERDVSEMEYMETWVEVMFNDEIAAGNYDIGDERELEGRTLHLRDPWGPREGYATISLE
jgi:hypothetical protein